jgi:hypothetical protein
MYFFWKKEPSRVRISKDEVRTKDLYWYMKMIYNPKRLVGISLVVDGVLQCKICAC